VEIQPAGAAKAQTLSQASKLLQLCRGNIRRLSGKENPEGFRLLMLDEEGVATEGHPYNEFFMGRNADLNLAVALAGAVAQDRERDHHDHCDEHDDDRNLQRC
jgi:hypothetical protein